MRTTNTHREPLFVVVKLLEPTMRRGVLCYWACRNTQTGRIWKQTYCVHEETAHRRVRDLTMRAEIEATHGNKPCLHWNQLAPRRHSLH